MPLKSVILFICFTAFFLSTSAQTRRIEIVHSDNSTIDEERLPGATILLGNVFVRHEGITLQCTKAVHFTNQNYIKAYGNVVLNQGDTIRQTSEYTEYNGNSQKALSWGSVVLTDPKMQLTTDTLHFDRTTQTIYYRNNGTLKDEKNVLKSRAGYYYLETNKYQALSNVVITNPDYVLESDHLDYFTNHGTAYLFGPTTITSKKNSIYCEKGFYDTKNNISHFTKNAIIKYNDREIVADSLFYNRTTGFASATKNIQITDTISNMVLRGGYAEYFEKKDSAFAVQRAYAITNTNADSLFIHGDTLLLTGKPEKRIIRAYHNVKFFKSDLSGKCDSIHSNQENGLTQMFKLPVLWAKESQITGAHIQLLSDVKTEKLDSIKVLKDAFIIQKDSLGFNQIKGRDILGKFEDNDLKIADVIGNGEIIHYVRNENKELIGIDKTTCSSIRFTLDNGEIQSAKFMTLPDGETYPPSKLPENVRKLRGFVWREDERPKTKDDIFIH